MATPCVISDSNTRVKAKVTKFGQLVVAPIQYSTPITQDMDVITTAFNFIVPEQGSSIVITDIFVAADNAVSNTAPAEVELYTADGPDSLTVIDSILQPRLTRSKNVPITSLNLLIGEGVWVNGKTNDNNILLTVMFYRVPAEDV